MLVAHSIFKRFVLPITVVGGVLTAASVVQPPAKAVRAFPASWPCCAVSTKAIEIAQGQTARFALKNTGDESLDVHLQLVDKEGTALQQADATIKPWKDSKTSSQPNRVQSLSLINARHSHWR